jgi:hypothetical protein
MSQDKTPRRVRREKARKQIKRQLRIVNFYYSAPLPDAFGSQPQGAWRKQNALNCGRSGCCMCCNPRRIFGAVTLQEQRIEQALKQDLEALQQQD